MDSKVEESRHKLKDSAYKRLIARYSKLKDISESKIEQVANYIITNLGEVTPLLH